MREGYSKPRKTRSDKKKEVKATLSIALKNAIHRLSYITNTPIKDVCEKLCHELIIDRKIIDTLSGYFQHEVIYDGTMFRGHYDNVQIAKRFEGKTSIATMTFTRSDYDIIYKIAYALGVSPSRCVALLLDMAMRDINVVNQYIKDYLKKELSPYELEELKQLISYTNRSNVNHQTWASFLGYIYEQKGSPMFKMREIINEFLNEIKLGG